MLERLWGGKSKKVLSAEDAAAQEARKAAMKLAAERRRELQRVMLNDALDEIAHPLAFPEKK